MLPKMILFDYGQTLISEKKFDGVSGTEAVLKYATKNKYNKTAIEVQKKADEINNEIGRFDPNRWHLYQLEIPNDMFTTYLYGSLGIELSLSSKEIDETFWNAASPGEATKGIKDFLDYLKYKGIRTGVISNISYCQEAVEDRINRLIPSNNFEFIMATSKYMYRKPNKRIFDLALEKADLTKDEVWYVGDNYNCDVIGAKNAGMFPVWYLGAICFEYEDKDDVLKIKSWKELKDYMEEI